MSRINHNCIPQLISKGQEHFFTDDLNDWEPPQRIQFWHSVSSSISLNRGCYKTMATSFSGLKQKNAWSASPYSLLCHRVLRSFITVYYMYMTEEKHLNPSIFFFFFFTTVAELSLLWQITNHSSTAVLFLIHIPTCQDLASSINNPFSVVWACQYKVSQNSHRQLCRSILISCGKHLIWHLPASRCWAQTLIVTLNTSSNSSGN